MTVKSEDLYQQPSDVRINRWRQEGWYLLAPPAIRVGHGFRDLLILDCNGEVRRLIREGYQPVPQDAAMFLLEFEELEPFPPGWGREGLFLVAEGDAATIALDATADDALESYLEAGYRLATFDELGGVLPAHKTPPTTLIRSWVHARLAALTPPPKQEP